MSPETISPTLERNPKNKWKISWAWLCVKWHDVTNLCVDTEAGNELDCARIAKTFVFPSTRSPDFVKRFSLLFDGSFVSVGLGFLCDLRITVCVCYMRPTLCCTCVWCQPSWISRSLSNYWTWYLILFFLIRSWIVIISTDIILKYLLCVCIDVLRICDTCVFCF